jgi:CheY-like chemotaxis protein
VTQAAMAAVTDGRAAGANGRVLIVDDDYGIRDALGQILADEGHQVASASNGREALDRLRQGDRPCVILLDLMMPVMNGWEFIDRQRHDEELAVVPVVVISADARVSEKATALGVSGFLEKPIDLDRLLDAVERFCR